jgi:hypothetical protein
VDFEGAHGLEPIEDGDEAHARRLRDLESLVAADAAFVTAAGHGVASYYRDRYGVDPLVIDNVFALGARPLPRDRRTLSLYWFSQTIGPRRGLDLLIDSLGRAAVPVKLALRGRTDARFASALVARAAGVAPLVDLHIEPPADPDQMVEIAARYDVGVSLEDQTIPHRALCTPNKLFVYLAGGLAVAASPTPGQQPILATAGGAVVPIDGSDTSRFEAAVRLWSRDRSAIDAARLAAWDAAAARWRWDHPCARDALVRRVAEVLS